MQRAPLRMVVGSKIVEGFFWGAAKAGQLHPLSRPERHGVEVIRNLSYLDTGMNAHRLDLYRPIGAKGPIPVCLYVHGGGFRILSKETHWLMGLLFARRGYLVLNVNYRLAPRYPFPRAVEDVCAAYEWMLDNASKWGGDLSRLVFAGESAGANLITALSVALCYDRPEHFARRARERAILPKAVVPACGMFEVSNTDRFASMGVSRFVLDRMVEVTHAYLPETISEHERDLADPLRLFERGERPLHPLPPFFAPCGAIDPLADDTRRLGEALGKLGVRCETRLYDGGHHAFHAFVLFKNARQCWRDTFEFLGDYIPGQLTPVPPIPQ
jgi:acetyl esterase